MVLDRLKTDSEKTEKNFEAQTVQISTLKDTTLQQSFLTSALQKDIGSVDGKLSANLDDDRRQWETLRAIEAQAKAALTREQFTDWRMEYERRNPGSIAPSIPQ